MLKIYKAFSQGNKIILNDGLNFQHGFYDTGKNGFGIIGSGNLNCDVANYELQQLKDYKRYLECIEILDGYVKNFLIVNPYSYQGLFDVYKDFSLSEVDYEKYSLNEEAILLFTDFVYIKNYNPDLVQKIFGRFPETAMYLLLPNATFDMFISDSKNSDVENYEVLQSNGVGQRLILQQMKRIIRYEKNID